MQTLGSEAGNKPEGENGQRENELPEEKDQEKHQYQAVTLEKSPETEHFLREKGEEELRAVQRRDGHEVKDRQNEVDEDDDGRNLDESRAGPPGRGPKAKQKPENQSERDVGKRAGPGHYRLRPVAGAQIVGIVRHGLGPADDKAAQKIWNGRHQYRADKVQVFDGIEGQSPLVTGRLVAQKAGCVAVGNLVNDDGHDEHGYLEEEIKRHPIRKFKFIRFLGILGSVELLTGLVDGLYQLC